MQPFEGDPVVELSRRALYSDDDEWTEEVSLLLRDVIEWKVRELDLSRE